MRITKHSDSHLLAHLYEHLYFIHLDTALRDMGFFSIIDYSIDAFTEEGEVVFDIEPYTQIDLAGARRQATAEFLTISDLLPVALSQLECEYEQTLQFDNLADVEFELQQLNVTKWNDDSRYQAKSNLLTIGDSIETHNLRLTIDYEGVDTVLKPLYRQVAGVTLDVMVSDIADTYGGFVASETYATDEHRNLIGIVRLKIPLPENELDNIFLNTKQELTEKNGYERLLNTLHDVKMLGNPPSNERTYQDTGVLMSNEKWHEITTKESLNNTVRHLHFKANTIIGS